MTVNLKSRPCNDERSESGLAFPKVQRNLEKATDHTHDKTGWKADRTLDTKDSGSGSFH